MFDGKFYSFRIDAFALSDCGWFRNECTFSRVPITLSRFLNSFFASLSFFLLIEERRIFYFKSKPLTDC